MLAFEKHPKEIVDRQTIGIDETNTF